MPLTVVMHHTSYFCVLAIPFTSTCSGMPQEHQKTTLNTINIGRIISEGKNMNISSNNNIIMTCNTKNIYQRKEKLHVSSKNNASSTQPEYMILHFVSLPKSAQTFCTHTLCIQHELASLYSPRKETERHSLKPVFLYETLNKHFRRGFSRKEFQKNDL